MQIAYRAKDITEAHIVAGFLEARGIECHVGGHYLQGGMGEIGTSGFTNVHVEDEDFDLAREVVEEYEEQQQQDTAESLSATAGPSRVNQLAGLFLIGIVVVVIFVLLLL